MNRETMQSDQLKKTITQFLRSAQCAGVSSISPAGSIEIASIEPESHSNEPESGSDTSHAAMAETTGTKDGHDMGKETLAIVEQEVSQCTQCKELVAIRTQTVFGVGNPNADLVFFGEAPGRDEDKQGIPFVGRAGQLLTKIIEAMGLQRDDVYILNTVKCRPPDNRNPSPEEQENCKGFLNRQLALINPKYICCLGSVPSKNLLETKETIGKLRGVLHEVDGRKVLCTYHPAYLLRNPSAKQFVWDDVQILMKDMGLPIPKT